MSLWSKSQASQVKTQVMSSQLKSQICLIITLLANLSNCSSPSLLKREMLKVRLQHNKTMTQVHISGRAHWGHTLAWSQNVV